MNYMYIIFWYLKDPTNIADLRIGHNISPSQWQYLWNLLNMPIYFNGLTVIVLHVDGKECRWEIKI